MLGKFGIDVDLYAFTTSASTLKGLVRNNLAISAMASSSVPDDLNLITHANLPPLPAIDIVLITATRSHPLLSASVVSRLTQAFASTRSEHANIAQAI